MDIESVRTKLDDVREAQTEYWNALRALENELGVEFDFEPDFRDSVTVDSLMEMKKQNEELSR